MLRLLAACCVGALIVTSALSDPEPRRRGPNGGRHFEARPGMGHARYAGDELSDNDKEQSEAADSITQKPILSLKNLSALSTDAGGVGVSERLNEKERITSASELKLMERSESDEEKTVSILKGNKSTEVIDFGFELENVAAAPTHLKDEQIYWIDATYKANDAGMNISKVEECTLWQKYWSMNELNLTSDDFLFITSVNESNPFEESSSEEVILKIPLIEYEVVESKSRLKELQLSTDLFDKYEMVGVLFKEICGNHDRQLIFKTPEDARKVGVSENSTICNPFKEELHPNTDILTKLSLDLNQFVEKNRQRNNSSLAKAPAKKSAEELKIFLVSSHNTVNTMSKNEETQNAENEAKVTKDGGKLIERRKRKISEKEKDTINSEKEKTSNGKEKTPGTTTTPAKTTNTDPSSAEENADDADWLELLEISNQVFEHLSENETMFLEKAWIQIDATDETSPVMYILYPESADTLGLTISHHAFRRFQKVGLFLPGICADFVPTAIDAFNASHFEGIEIEGPIGVNITALEMAGVNLTELAEKLRNDTEVDEILTRTNSSSRALGGSYILPVLNKNQYDPFSAPIVFQGSAVVVRFGIYIESMSNFQTSTMDYDMDIYLLLAWRDARLVNPYDKPILVKEEEILEKIWRPDPFFDAKEAEFHEVTFLNFLMRIYSDGLVLYETRIKLKPACNLVLCKYPHDKQTCELQIKSFAYPIETVRFEWFTRKVDAIDKNPDVKLPELYIDRYEPTFCNRSRKSGHFSCLRAVFRLKRDVGFHIAQTYIPTSLALMFSWVGVWLPEEFMEGRIGVAITVLLTLSTESAGAREHLPSVSYLKAIDLWFGYITGFVFFTLLQTLFIIGFDKRANQLRKWANRKRLDLTQETRDSMIMKANRYHKTGRYLDNFCRVFYPLSFLLFLIMYYFVFTEGRQDDCISTR